MFVPGESSQPRLIFVSKAKIGVHFTLDQLVLYHKILISFVTKQAILVNCTVPSPLDSDPSMTHIFVSSYLLPI